MSNESHDPAKRGLQTELLHHDDHLTAGWTSFVPPVTRASTVVFPNLAAVRALQWRDDSQWRYGLHATPTSTMLTNRLALLEGGRTPCCSRRDCRRS